jgi:hypothetical protein
MSSPGCLAPASSGRRARQLQTESRSPHYKVQFCPLFTTAFTHISTCVHAEQVGVQHTLRTQSERSWLCAKHFGRALAEQQRESELRVHSMGKVEHLLAVLTEDFQGP